MTCHLLMKKILCEQCNRHVNFKHASSSCLLFTYNKLIVCFSQFQFINESDLFQNTFQRI